MIWKNAELFNVSEMEEQADGSIRVYRFPQRVRAVFEEGAELFKVVGELTTGCELRFVGEAADVTLSSNEEGTVEIYRGDFLHGIVRLRKNEPQKIELRTNLSVDKYDISGYKETFSTAVWRVISDHDMSVTFHALDAIKPIRPPKAEELPRKKLLAYGSSITHSAIALHYTNSYIATVGRLLGVDVLNKGMGGSCFCQKEVGDYIALEDWDIATLELGINMVESVPVEEYEKRAEYIVKRALEKGKPVVMISNFTSFRDFPNDKFKEKNDAYVRCYERIYERLQCENLYYIRGRDIITDIGYLAADLIHPSPYGHGEMGRKIAKKMRDEFHII